MNLRMMQSLSAAQNAGNTLVPGVPGGFVPLKPGAKPAPKAILGTGNTSSAAAEILKKYQRRPRG